MVKNGLQAIALNRRLALGSKLWSQRGRAQLTALDLPRHTAQRREDNLELLTWLEAHIADLDARIADAARAHPSARLLLAHPGVGDVPPRPDHQAGQRAAPLGPRPSRPPRRGRLPPRQDLHPRPA
jgi:hypothetical protein